MSPDSDDRSASEPPALADEALSDPPTRAFMTAWQPTFEGLGGVEVLSEDRAEQARAPTFDE